MFRFLSFKKNSTLIALVVVVLLASTLFVDVFGAADLTSTVAVFGLSVNSSGGTDWTASAGTLAWTGTTTSDKENCETVYTSTDGAVVLKNTSGEQLRLSFNYTVSLEGGSFTLDGKVITANGSFTKILKNGESVTLTAKTVNKKTGTTTINITGISLKSESITVTYGAPENGSYTVDGASITANTSKSTTTANTHKLVATPASNYVFTGWYIGDTKVYDSATVSAASFTGNATITPRFEVDPVYTASQKGENLSGEIADYIIVNSAYYHNPTGSNHTTTGTDGNNNSYGPTAYFADPAWRLDDGIVVSSASGTAGGDNQTEMGRSNAQAHIYSDIIRVRVLQSCIIYFECSITANTVDANDSKTTGVYFYYWVTTSPSATASQITTNGVKVIDGVTTGSGNGSATVRLNAGDYLYLYSRAHTFKEQYIFGSGSTSDKFSYTSKIQSFTISPSETAGTLEFGNYDSIGNLLKSGTVLVNSTAYSMNSGVESLKAQQGTQYTLKPGTAPSGYTFIGWSINGTPNYTQYEYSFELAEGTTTIQAIYVPAMVIAASGENGYGSATYTLNSSTYNTGSNPYFVARNVDCSQFYTDLKSAFENTNVVVLLAGHTINGDMIIPQGKTLVIPYGFADNGISGDDPDQTTTYESIKNYCVVRFNGNLTIHGKLLVNGNQTGLSSYAGRPSGGIGCFVLGDSSVVSLNGTLYAYGHVRGGQINAAATATVHELAEFGDRRAILIMKEITDKKKDYYLMPFNALAIESIESSVTYTAGAQLIAHFSVLMEGADANSSDKASVIHPDSGLFVLTKGSMTKYYDFENNQTVWRMDKGASVQTGNMYCKMTYTHPATQVSQSVELNSTEFVFPLNQGHCLEVAGDLTFNSSFKFLPGSRFIVTETGHCTIASDADIIIYRMNDYDTRKPGDKNNYAGYSVTGYPCWSMQYPLGGYTAKKALKDLGSAKLVVDGLITVNGGLFVTNEMVSETNQGIESFIITNADGTTTTQDRLAYNQEKLAKYNNGYNVISGSGIIDMTNAKSTTEKVWEVMQMSGTNAGGYYGIPVVAVKGLLENTSVDDPEKYLSMSCDIFYGMPNEHGLTIWVTKGSANWGQGYIASNVELGNNLNFYFAFFHSDISTNSGHYIRINGGDPIYIDQWIFDDASSDNTVNYYIVVYEGLSAKQMTERVMVTLYNDKGVALDFWTDSIQAYSMRILKQNPGNADLGTLIVDMLNYGAACQQYFAKKAGTTVPAADLANALLSEEQKTYATSSVIITNNFKNQKGDNIYFAAATLIADGSIQFALKVTESFTSGMSVTYSFVNHWGNGNNNLPERDAKEYSFTHTGAEHYFITQLVVADARQMITFKVGDVEWEDSIESYCARMIESGDDDAVFEAFMKFADAAEAYLEGGNRVQ